MIGVISDNTLKGKLNDLGQIKGKLFSDYSMVVDIGNASISRPNYDGDYTITPSINEQTLETKNKVMTDDLNIKQIPYFQTSNEYGDTIYIGKEVDYGN